MDGPEQGVGFNLLYSQMSGAIFLPGLFFFVPPSRLDTRIDCSRGDRHLNIRLGGAVCLVLSSILRSNAQNRAVSALVAAEHRLGVVNGLCRIRGRSQYRERERKAK